jgi:hypothetical protein
MPKPLTTHAHLLATAFGAALLGAGLIGSPPAAAQSSGSSAAGQALRADAQTIKIVEAAQGFLDGLTGEQRAAALFAFTDREQRVRWSNLPEGLFERKGLRWRELADGQRAALMNLLGQVLSPRGLRMVEQQLAADDLLMDAGLKEAVVDWLYGIDRGRDYYYVAFLGEPSTTKPWTLQFGGHHLAINATVVGPHVTLSPTLTGGHPVRFMMEGERVDMAGGEVAAATGLFNSLTDQQRHKAWIDRERIDLVAGPGQDGQVPRPEGLPGREMSAAQKAQLLELIEARLGILNADDLAPKIAAAKAGLDDTYFAWFGPRPEEGAAYWRVTGPRVLLEFSPQSRGGDPSNHLHNIYRDPGNDYGASWISAE